MAQKTKSFKASIDPVNPAMQFISAPAAAAPPPALERRESPPEGFKVNPLYVETKSRRLQLLLQPSLYEKIKKLSLAQGVSVNEFVHSLLESAAEGLPGEKKSKK